MSITAPEALRRGAVNVRANWETAALRCGELLVMVALSAGAVFAISWPIMRRAAETGQQPDMGKLITEHPLAFAGVIILWIAVATVFVLLHSFVSAGNVRVYIDAERAALVEGSRVTPRRAFDMRRWLDAAREAMWRIAGVYLAIGAAMLLVVLLVGSVFSLVGKADSPVAGCCALVILIPLFIAVAILTSLLTMKAITLTVDQPMSVGTALRAAWADSTRSMDTHIAAILLIGIAVFIAAIAVGILTMVVSYPFLKAGGPRPAFVVWPVQIVMTIVNQFLSALSSSWFYATMVALTPEVVRKRGNAGVLAG